MANESDNEGTLLWVGGEGSASRALVEAATHEFKLAVRFCAPAELFEAIRSARCELVGLELDADPRTGLALLAEIHQRMPRLTLLAAADDASVAVIRAALDAGASDVLTLPLARAELHKALIKFTQARARTPTARNLIGDVITVCGARGGLGVTTIAVNLAVRLASLTGAEVALVDLDLQRGDVAAFLNLTPHQSLAAVAGARGEVDDIFLHSTMTRHASGVFVLPAPLQIEEADLIGHDEVNLVLGLLRSQFRYTVVDTARTITGATLAAFEHADRIFVLSDLSVPGVRAARRAVELLTRLNNANQRVELLVTHSVPGPVEVKDAARTIGQEPFLVIPRDEVSAGRAMNAGAPLDGAAQTGLARAVNELAVKLTGVGSAPRARRGHLLRRMFVKDAAA